jgi:hypothetical protein
MVQIYVESKGERYKLKYQKINNEIGQLYQGILFLKDPIGFSYIVKSDKSILFDNKFLDKHLRELIIRSIEYNEAN